jgi:hypothetical protein
MASFVASFLGMLSPSNAARKKKELEEKGTETELIPEMTACSTSTGTGTSTVLPVTTAPASDYVIPTVASVETPSSNTFIPDSIMKDTSITAAPAATMLPAARKRKLPTGVKKVAKTPTKAKIDKRAPPPSRPPRSQRRKVRCGICSKECGALMWMATSKDGPCPMVPTHFLLHLICLQCCPQLGRDDIDLDEVLDKERLALFPTWKKYTFVVASRTDYEKYVGLSNATNTCM